MTVEAGRNRRGRGVTDEAVVVPGDRAWGGARAWSMVVSCEHAGHDVPEAYRVLFASRAARAALRSHRGWDRGSVEIGEQLARELESPLVVQRVSRLLVDCNRSLGHPALFSEFSRGLSESERAVVLDRYWRPHRDAVRRLVDAAPPETTVLHVGIHTFTPVWEGVARTTDVGVLYDPRRTLEAAVARRWRDALVGSPAARAGLRIHLNRPYRGWTDGLTTTLRGERPEGRYLGIELEVSQRLVPVSVRLVSAIGTALRAAVERVADG